MARPTSWARLGYKTGQAVTSSAILIIIIISLINIPAGLTYK